MSGSRTQQLVGLDPGAPWPRVKHFTTERLRCQDIKTKLIDASFVFAFSYKSAKSFFVKNADIIFIKCADFQGIGLSILRPSIYRSPYIFRPVQKVKIEHTKFMLLSIKQDFVENLKVISVKNDVYFLYRRS